MSQNPQTAAQMTPGKAIQAEFDAMKKILNQAVGDDAFAEQAVASAMTLVRSDPDLLACSPRSIVDSVIAAARMKLLVGKESGLAWLIPYKGVCTLQIGWKGYVELLYRSGAYGLITTFVVHEGEADRLTIRVGTESVFDFRPMPFGRKGKPIGFVAFVKLASGEWDYEAMSVEEVEQIRDRSQAWKRSGKSSPWGTDFTEMARKTVLKRYAKRGRISPTDRTLLDEADAEAGDVIDTVAEVTKEMPRAERAPRIVAAADEVRERAALPESAGGAIPTSAVPTEAAQPVPVQAQAQASKGQLRVDPAPVAEYRATPAPKGDAGSITDQIADAEDADQLRAAMQRLDDAYRGGEIDAYRHGKAHDLGVKKAKRMGVQL